MKEVARGKRDKNALTHPKPRAPYTFEMAEQKKGRKEIDATTKKNSSNSNYTQRYLNTCVLCTWHVLRMHLIAHIYRLQSN